MARSGLARLFVRGAKDLGFDRQARYGRLQTNVHGDVAISQALPPLAELVRLGSSWRVSNPAGGGAKSFMPPNPSDTIHLKLWNLERVGGKHYLIDTANARFTTAGTASAHVVVLWAAVTAKARDIGFGDQPAPGATDVPTSLNGRKRYNGRAFVSDFAGDFGHMGAGAWHTIGSAIVCANTAVTNLELSASLYGRYIVPPGGLFSLTVQTNGTAPTPLSVCDFSWHEVQVPQGVLTA